MASPGRTFAFPDGFVGMDGFVGTGSAMTSPDPALAGSGIVTFTPSLTDLSIVTAIDPPRQRYY